MAPADPGRFAEHTTQQLLRACCAVTGMEAGHVAERRGGRHVVRAVWDASASFGLDVGDPYELADSLCARIVDGRAPRRVGDVTRHPETHALLRRAGAPARSYAALPLHDPHDRVVGVVLCLDRVARPDLADPCAAALEGLAATLGSALTALTEEADALRAHDEHVQSLAHDLRTPLLALRHLGQDLGAGLVDPARSGHQLDEEARRLLGLVAAMLPGSPAAPDAPASHVRPTHLGQLARDALTIVEGAEGLHPHHRFLLALPDEPLVADVDPVGILRALQNLLVNAVTYSPGGGTIQLRLTREGRRAAFAVRDEGMGIDAADLPQLTERRFRGEAARQAGIAGTGLGLTSVQTIVDEHDGTLSVVSAPGAGATFTLRLPLRPGPPSGEGGIRTLGTC